MGVPQTVYSGPSTTVAKPKSPSFKDLVPLGYSHTYDKQWKRQKGYFYPPGFTLFPLDILYLKSFFKYKVQSFFFTGFVSLYCCVCQRCVIKSILRSIVSVQDVFIPVDSQVWCLDGRYTFCAGIWELLPGRIPSHKHLFQCILLRRWLNQTDLHPETQMAIQITKKYIYSV